MEFRRRGASPTRDAPSGATIGRRSAPVPGCAVGYPRRKDAASRGRWHEPGTGRGEILAPGCGRHPCPGGRIVTVQPEDRHRPCRAVRARRTAMRSSRHPRRPRMKLRRYLVPHVIALSLGGVAFAQETEIPLANWTAPPYWTPPAAEQARPHQTMAPGHRRSRRHDRVGVRRHHPPVHRRHPLPPRRHPARAQGRLRTRRRRAVRVPARLVRQRRDPQLRPDSRRLHRPARRRRRVVAAVPVRHRDSGRIPRILALRQRPGDRGSGGPDGAVDDARLHRPVDGDVGDHPGGRRRRRLDQRLRAVRRRCDRPGQRLLRGAAGGDERERERRGDEADGGRRDRGRHRDQRDRQRQATRSPSRQPFLRGRPVRRGRPARPV